MSNKYNGWTNYETWNCKLWIDNDQSLFESISEHIYFLKNEKEYDKDKVIIKMSDWIKDQIVEPYSPNLKASMYSDMLSASLREINYYEISQSIYDDLWSWVDDAQKNKNVEVAWILEL